MLKKKHKGKTQSRKIKCSPDDPISKDNLILGRYNFNLNGGSAASIGSIKGVGLRIASAGSESATYGATTGVKRGEVAASHGLHLFLKTI